MVYSPFFKEINSNEKAWALGWLVSDGSLSGKSYSTMLEIKKSDFWVLNKFLNLIPGSKYFFRKNRNTAAWYINSKEVQEDLKKNGLVPKKQKIIKPPNIDNKYLQSFWQGVWEGNGFINIWEDKRSTRVKNNGYTFMFGLTANNFMCDGFKDHFSLTTGVHPHGTTFITRKSLSKHPIFNEIFLKLYDKENIRKGLLLPRKYALMCDIKEYYEMIGENT